nr:hypothetical protein [Tanacetum cinerariifolium]
DDDRLRDGQHEGQLPVLETQARRHEWQRQTADDLVVQHIMRTQALEAGARIDTLKNTGRTYAAGNSDRNIYAGSKPLCSKCDYHHEAMAQMRATVPSTYHSLLPSGTPPLLPIPLPVPSPSRRAEIPEADTPPRKRLLLTAPRHGCEVRESSAAAAARQPGPTMARCVDYSFVDTMETRF